MTKLLAIIFVLLGAIAHAHESPNELIHRLTHELEQDSTNAALLLMRGTECRAAGHLEQAEQDYRRVIELHRDRASAYILLAQMLEHEDRNNEALALVKRALKIATVGDHWDELHRLNAIVMTKLGDWDLAQQALDAMSAEARSDIDVVLLQSRVYREQGGAKGRVTFLTSAVELNGAIVLEIEFIDALVAVGHLSQALERTKSHLASRRLKAEWLLRRATIYETMGEIRNQERDLRGALEELETRVARANPDPHLVALLDDTRKHLSRVSGL